MTFKYFPIKTKVKKCEESDEKQGLIKKAILWLKGVGHRQE
jgi:hypothetical protein